MVVVERVERRSSSLRKREKSAHSAHTGPDLSATSIQSSSRRHIAFSQPPTIFLRLPFARFCSLLPQIIEHDHQAHKNNAHTTRSDTVCTTSDPVSIGTRGVGRTLCASPASSLGAINLAFYPPMHPRSPKRTHPQGNETSMVLFGHSTAQSVLLEPFLPPPPSASTPPSAPLTSRRSS